MGKRRNKGTKVRLTALVMALLMVMEAPSWNVLAAETETAESMQEESTAALSAAGEAAAAAAVLSAGDAGTIKEQPVSGEVESEPLIIGEIEEKRDAYTKYFLAEGGREVAAVYNEPVHFNDDGEWIEIDNSLELSDFGGEERYHNHAS